MTADELINTGVGVSYVNRPDTLALAGTELLGVLNREMEDMVHGGIRMNPWYFASAQTISYTPASSGWVLPAHELLLRVERSGEPVTVLSLGDRLRTDDDLPKAYYVRGVLQRDTLGATATIATTDSLSVLYVPVVQRLTATSQSPDSYLIPERHQNYLSYRIAVYLAAKDGRDDDQARFDAEAKRYLDRYSTFLREHQAAMPQFFVPAVQMVNHGMGTA